MKCGLDLDSGIRGHDLGIESVMGIPRIWIWLLLSSYA
jgi:hypothetical protein